MNIPGIAFKPNEEELSKKRSLRAKELHHLWKDIEIERFPEYGKTRFRGILKSEKAQALSEMDLACMVDSFCFGGECTINAHAFAGYYFID